MAHFSKQEIEEIRQRLAETAVKDSQLPIAESVNADDYIAIVQNGVSKKVRATALSDVSYFEVDGNGNLKLKNSYGGLWTNGFLVAYGSGEGSGAGYVDINDVWASLTNSVVDAYAEAKIDSLHIPVASAADVGGIKVGAGLAIAPDGTLSVTGGGSGTVTQINIGSAAFTPESGIVTLPAYPTTLPASDVYTWAKKNALDVADIPSITTGKISDIESWIGGKGFITSAVNDLVNYYKKSETYTQAEVNALVASVSSFHFEIYPTVSDVTDPQTNVLYLIGPSLGGSYEEYVYDPSRNPAWVKIGDTSIDLTGYLNSVTASGSGDYISGFTKSGSTLSMNFSSFRGLTIKNYLGTTLTAYSPNGISNLELNLSKSQIGLSNVENTALSTWLGSSNITTLGIITTGEWHGTAIANQYLANSTMTVGGATISLGGSANLSQIGIPGWAQDANLAFASLPALYIGGSRVKSSAQTAQALSGIGTLDASGLATLQGGISLGGQFNSVASKLVWDSDNNAWHLIGNFYADGYVSALGAAPGGGGGSGIDLDRVWASLTNTIPDAHSTDKIAYDHLPVATTGALGLVRVGNGLSITAGGVLSATNTSQGTVTRVYIGSDAYNPDSDGYVNLPSYPTSLPASDVYTWAKEANKPSYNFSEIGSKPTTISGYGITDAKINNGVITLGNKTITPLTSHQSIYGLVIKNSAGTSVLTYSPASSSGSLTLTKAMVGLGNVDNTSDSSKSVGSAAALTTPRTLWGQSFDGSANVSGALTGVTTIDNLLNFDATNGRLGIGNTPGAYLLDIDGTVRATGAATFDSTMSVSGLLTAVAGLKLTNTKKIWFGDTYYIELDSNNVLHTNAPIVSDSFITAGAANAN